MKKEPLKIAIDCSVIENLFNVANLVKGECQKYPPKIKIYFFGLVHMQGGGGGVKGIQTLPPLDFFFACFLACQRGWSCTRIPYTMYGKCTQLSFFFFFFVGTYRLKGIV